MLVEDDQKVLAKIAELEKAKKDISNIISNENTDPTKWKIEEIVSHIKLIESILRVR